MKRFLIGLLVVLLLAAGGLAIVAANYVPRAPKGVRVGSLNVGGLSMVEIEGRVKSWWLKEREQQVGLTLQGSDDVFTTTPASLGIDVDAAATARQVKYDSLLDSISRSVSGESSTDTYQVKLVSGKADYTELDKFVRDRVPAKRPARVRFVGGAIERTPEVAGFRLDKAQMPETSLQALKDGGFAQIPVIEDRKSVPDEDLEKILEVASEFTTRFSEGKATRSHNIRLAASRIDGLVLAPGEEFSFNKTVGRRTVAGGFKIAGVYKNGKHDVDVGGGICQVSSTLYNAALFADLKIPRRSNHSMPVPYVPLGRDATVDYGTVDLVIKNSFDQPIALNASVGRGSITFRILAVKDPTTSVKLVSSGARSWDVGIKQEPDPSLPAGKTKVIEKGSRGHAITTYRVVYKDGREVRRESLGQSFYRGGKRIVAVGTAQPAGAAQEDPPTTPPDTDDGLDGG